ncbi:MAG: toll/interleukin-1 receptor domain-containing protein [Chromatiales bacterium]|nr:toll/interleukin-1 receptor domain-containing protein [Chromatiales bacterium]
MSYVGEPFKHDIFVSYSHGDVDGTGVSKLKQWSQAFVRELESELRAHPTFGREVSLFLDQHLRPEQGLDPLAPLTDQLREDIGASAILTVLMSPQYQRSQWCDEERQWWRARQDELGLSADGRIAVARIWPTADAWPEVFCDSRGEQLIGFPFFDKTRAELRPQPYEWPEPEPDSKGPFRDALLDMVGWLGLRLQDLKDQLDEKRRQQADAARLGSGEGQVVYLHGRAEHARDWEQAGQRLSDSGFVVLPGEPDPIVQDPRRLQEIRRGRIEVLSGCDALLLVGCDDGRALDADLVVVGRQDRQSAKAVSNRPLPCALLDRVGGDVANPKRKTAAHGLRVEWIDATQDPWTPKVRQWLTSVANP